MNWINQKINKLNNELKQYLLSNNNNDFNSFYETFDDSILAYLLSNRFKGLWKLERIINNKIGGIENIKNDVLLDLHRGKFKKPTLNSLLNKISLKILRELGDREELLRILPTLLEYSHSITFNNYYDFQEITEFNDFTLLEIFNIIYDTFYTLIKNGKMVLFYHAILLLEEKDIRIVLKRKELDIKKEVLKEMQEFWELVDKKNIFYLFIVFIEAQGDLEQFKSFLNADTLKIFNERVNNKLSYNSVDKKLNIVGSEQILHHMLKDYIKSLRLVDDIMKNQEKTQYVSALWHMVSKPAFYNLTDFIKDLFNEEANIREFEQNIKIDNLKWDTLREIERINRFPKYYLEEYKFKSSIISLFTPI